MSTVIEFLTEPFQYAFMVRAFIGVSLIAVLSGVIGTFIMLKGLAFIGDAIAHAAFGGLVAAMLIGIPLHVGALVFGLGTAGLLTLLGRKTKLRADTSLAILFTGAFALGVLGLATRPNFAGDLSALLVGSVLAIGTVDIYWILAAAALTALIMAGAFRHLVFISFDPVGAESAGLPVTSLQLLLLSLVGLTVVVSLQAVGAVLVVALLITPAATASLYSRRMERVIGLAVLLGLTATWIGLYASYYMSTPPGATVVTVATLLFTVGLLLRRRQPGGTATARVSTRSRTPSSERADAPKISSNVRSPGATSNANATAIPSTTANATASAWEDEDGNSRRGKHFPDARANLLRFSTNDKIVEERKRTAEQ